MILFLYPTKTFQNILGFFSRVQWHPLHAFADAFNGCYKNGTNGSRDYRYFGAFYLIIRVVYHVTALFADLQIAILLILTPLVASLMFALMRPYKTDFYNIFDSLIFFFVIISQVAVTYNTYIAPMPLTLLFQAILLISIGHFMIVTSYSILDSCTPDFLGNLKKKVKLFWSNFYGALFRLGNNVHPKDHQNENSCDIESDRDRNREQYQHLVRSCNLHDTEHDNNYGSI